MAEDYGWLDAVPRPCWDNLARMAALVLHNGAIPHDELAGPLRIATWESELLLHTLVVRDYVTVRENHWSTPQEYMVSCDGPQLALLEGLIAHLNTPMTAGAPVTPTASNGVTEHAKKRGRPAGAKDPAKTAMMPVAQKLKDQEGWSDEKIASVMGKRRSTITGWLSEANRPKLLG